jgi:hypothetical protein
LNKYIKDGKLIEATERAFKLIYKGQGYIPYDMYLKEQEEAKRMEEEAGKNKSISKMNKEDLKELAIELGVFTEEEVNAKNVEELKAAIKAVKEVGKEGV